MNLNIDVIIVVSFLILTLIVGLGHGKNVKTLKDYALGGRNFSTGANQLRGRTSCGGYGIAAGVLSKRGNDG